MSSVGGQGNGEEKKPPDRKKGDGPARKEYVEDNKKAPGASRVESTDSSKRKEEARNNNDTAKRMFTKKVMIRTTEYKFGDLDLYLHDRYKTFYPIYRCLAEIAIVALLFMFLPLLAILISYMFGGDPGQSIMSIKNEEVKSYANNSLFFTLVYIIFVMTKVMVDEMLHLTFRMLRILDIQVEGWLETTFQILNSSNANLKNFMAALLIFFLASAFYKKYVFLQQTLDLNHLLMTLLLWYTCFSLIMFAKDILVNLMVYEFCRGSISGRIFDANYKAFVLKKLTAIAQKKSEGRDEMNYVIETMVNDFESNISLRHNDLDLTTSEAAASIVEAIFGYLEIENLTLDQVKVFFPANHDEVFKYLGNRVSSDGDTNIPFETIKEQAIKLHEERKDIMLSLVDQDTILRKLDFVLIGGVSFVALILLLFLFNVDYKVYLASVGPVLFTFGWIFQTSVVELYRCFVFLLLSHPFDSGDRVVIDNEELVVVSIDLMYTTFRNGNGMKIYIPNPAMFNKNIGNVRRSDVETEDVAVGIDESTVFSQVLDLCAWLQKSLKESEDDFTGVVSLGKYEPAKGKINLVLSVEHISNFQDPSSRHVRRVGFIKQLEAGLVHCRIQAKNGYTFKP